LDLDPLLVIVITGVTFNAVQLEKTIACHADPLCE
jgi:hypothetical protein